MIVYQQVSKLYQELIALNHFSLEIDDGEIIGLIGHNGAGKSTAIKCLIGMIPFEHGTIHIDELNFQEDPITYKRKIGYVSDNPNIFLNFTAAEYFQFITTIYQLDIQQAKQDIEHYSKRLNLFEHLDETLESFSHGMRQKVFIIATIITQPKVWILDEPMTGLDPQASFQLKEIMKEHAAKGNIVIFSTHVLEVAEHLCTRIAILNEGKLIYTGTSEHLKQATGGSDLESIYLSMVQS